MILMLASAGCTSHKEFVRSLDDDIGKTTKEAWVPDPSSVEPIDDQTSRYVYEYKDTGCQWFYVVDNRTNRILSWQFISDPNRCYMTMSLVP